MTHTLASGLDRQEGLLRNCIDSLLHALAHFSSITYPEGRFHNRKWAVISVAHAAELFCNYLLSSLDGRHPRGDRYPGLAAALEQLHEHTEAHRLSTTERHVLRDVLTSLPKLRNTLMHRTAPESLEVSDAAIVLLALLYLVRRRTGVAVSELFGQDPTIEIDVLDELRLREQERWFKLAEQLVLEDYGFEYLEGCDNCGCMAVTPDLGCQACFVER